MFGRETLECNDGEQGAGHCGVAGPGGAENSIVGSGYNVAEELSKTVVVAFNVSVVVVSIMLVVNLTSTSTATSTSMVVLSSGEVKEVSMFTGGETNVKAVLAVVGAEG